MSRFTKDSAFDTNSIQDETIKEAMRPFIEQYNAMVQELGVVLRGLTFSENFGGKILNFSFASGQDFIVGAQGKNAIILESSVSIESWKLTSQSNGLIANVVTTGGVAGTVKLLIL